MFSRVSSPTRSRALAILQDVIVDKSDSLSDLNAAVDDDAPANMLPPAGPGPNLGD